MPALLLQVTREVFEASKGRLKVVGRAGVGVDNVDLAAATEVRAQWTPMDMRPAWWWLPPSAALRGGCTASRMVVAPTLSRTALRLHCIRHGGGSHPQPHCVAAEGGSHPQLHCVAAEGGLLS
jgi:hypothetical protein